MDALWLRLLMLADNLVIVLDGLALLWAILRPRPAH